MGRLKAERADALAIWSNTPGLLAHKSKILALNSRTHRELLSIEAVQASIEVLVSDGWV
jgi:hypothetical protein